MINNCLFAENEDGSVKVYGPKSYLRVQSSVFSDNYGSKFGAAITVGEGYLAENVLEVLDSEFVRIAEEKDGGALAVWTDNHVLMRNCSRRDSWAWDSGGAVVFSGGSSYRARRTIRESVFSNNSVLRWRWPSH